MGAPTATARQTPAGIRLLDGYQTLITFAGDPDISFWEKTVTPPGLDGGDAIPTTTMHNVLWRTMAARALIDLTELTLTAAYDPDLYDEIKAILNINDQITVTFPDGSTLAFWGFLRLFDVQSMEGGSPPEANITIQPTNTDGSGAEQGPVMTEVEGT